MGVNSQIQGGAQGISAKTRFHVTTANGKLRLIGSDNKPFFSFGVCCVDRGLTPEKYKPQNSGYAAYRYYTGAGEWAQDTADRLSKWGFNTVGAWSDDTNLLAAKASDLRFTPILHMGSSAGAPWRDLWDPKTVATMDAVARDGIRSKKNDHRVIGYFADNELGWWNGAMFEWGFKAGPASRAHVLALLRQRYQNSWSKLLNDFDPDGASSFESLAKKGRLFLRPGGNGMQTVHAWMEIVSGRYYSLCRSIVKKYDPGALYLGDRYISNFYPEVARSAGKYCDIVSTNLNADWNDGTFARFYLPTLRRITGKPLMITEYYVSAMENRSGNKNDSSGFPVVQTQEERAKVFRRSTGIFMGSPYIVGAHWFQYYDEPKNGRDDGENYDMGLVDIENRPYEPLVSAARAMAGYAGLEKRLPAVNGAPSVDASTIADLGMWPRDRAYVPPLGNAERGDLYVARDDKSLYIALYWNEDRFGEAFYRGGHVPASERAHFVVRLSDRKTPITAWLGDEGKPVVSGATIVSYKTGVRNTAILRIPLTTATVRVDATLDTRGRAYRMRWSQDLKARSLPLLAGGGQGGGSLALVTAPCPAPSTGSQRPLSVNGQSTIINRSDPHPPLPLQVGGGPVSPYSEVLCGRDARTTNLHPQPLPPPRLRA